MSHLDVVLSEWHESSAGKWDDWHESVRSHLKDSSVQPSILTKQTAWILTGWSEQAASRAVQTGHSQLIIMGVDALAMVDDTKLLDQRDLLAVVGLLKRSAALLNLTPKALYLAPLRESSSESPIVEAFRFMPERENLGHVETGEGPSFQFVRKQTNFDEGRILKWLDGGNVTEGES